MNPAPALETGGASLSFARALKIRSQQNIVMIVYNLRTSYFGFEEDALNGRIIFQSKQQTTKLKKQFSGPALASRLLFALPQPPPCGDMKRCRGVSAVFGWIGSFRVPTRRDSPLCRLLLSCRRINQQFNSFHQRTLTLSVDCVLRVFNF